MNITENNTTTMPGDLDRTFADNGMINIPENGTANSIASDDSGRLLVVLRIGKRFRLSRYLVDGATDASFEQKTWNFEDGDESIPTRILLQGDKKIVVIGRSIRNGVMRPAVVRFNPHGSPDLVFGRRVMPVPDNTSVATIPEKAVDGCLQKGDKVLVSAQYRFGGVSERRSRLYCLLTNGEVDPAFGEGQGFIDISLHDQSSYVQDVQTQSTGSIIVAGWANSLRRRTVARYNDRGRLDYTFGQGGFADIEDLPESNDERTPLDRGEAVSRVSVQSDDKILVAGNFRISDGRNEGFLARLDKHGSPDGEFNKGKPLLLSLDDLTLNSMAIQSDGKIVVVGRNYLGEAMEYYQRISAAGEPESFWRGHSVGDCSDVAIQPLGRVVISGSIGTGPVENRNPTVWGRLGREIKA